MKPLRVAQVGTSDLDNLGDLLFPIVLRGLLAELAREQGRAIECLHFGPQGRAAGALYRDQLESLPLAAFAPQDARAPFDLIFIGGGDLLRDDDAALERVYAAQPPHLPYSFLLSPTADPAPRLVLLMPGAPFEFGTGLAEFLRNSFTRLRAAAVRDRITAARLAPLLHQRVPLRVLPDIAAALPHFHPREALLAGLAQTLPAACKPGAYLCFQGNAGYGADVEQVERTLRMLEQDCGLPVLLLETGVCLGDGGLLGVLAGRHGFASAGAPQRVLDRVAVIAGARAFIGGSLHGNLLARAYGVPQICYSGAMLAKIRGYFELCGGGLLFDSFAAMAARTGEVVRHLAAEVPGGAAPDAYGPIRDFVAHALATAQQPAAASGFCAVAEAQYRACQQELTRLRAESIALDLARRDSAAQLARTELQLALAESRLAGMQASTSWRMTAPLRTLRTRFKR